MMKENELLARLFGFGDEKQQEDRHMTENSKEKTHTHWAKRKDRFYPTLVTHDSVPSAVYEARLDGDDNVYLREIEFPTDELLLIPGTPVDYVLNQIEEFWTREKFFQDLGLVYKRGVMFYGPSGCGKTSIIRILANAIIKRNGIVLSITDITNAQDALLQLRQIEPTRPIMCIFEDIEKLTENKETESDVLSFLDGEKQISNVVNIATTNKPDLLEDRLLRRPGRFDLVIGLNPPVKQARRTYLARLFKSAPVEEQEMTRMVEQTDGLGMAHLRELAVSMLAFGHKFDDVLRRMRGNVKAVFKMPKLGEKSTDTGYTLGFTRGENDETEEN